MDTLVYLDIDDEVTTAAARIREAEPGLVVLVVPSGSRIATSRINFRVLAREAEDRRRELAIVAPDAATRAMAEAAGLTAYGTVGQYEDASRASGAAAAGAAAAGAGAAGAAVTGEPAAEKPRGKRPGQAAGAAAAAAAGVAAAGVAPGGAAAPDEAAPATDPAARGEAPAAGSEPMAGDARSPSATVEATPMAPEPLGSEPVAPEPGPAAQPAVTEAGRPAGPVATLPVRGGVRSTGGGISRRAVAAAAAIVGLGLAGLLAAVFLLPSATITITPLTTTVGPVALEVRGDPAATEVDVEAAVVPAQRPEFPLSASGSFPATGKKVEETKASGTVTFTSKDPTQTNRIPAGSVVSTPAGVGFRTLAAVTVPRAKIEGLTIIPGRINVRVEAVKGGPEGNVAANSITIIPAGEDPVLTAVANGADTGGGSRTETLRVTAKDVDAAVKTLEAQLDEQFDAALADPGTIPAPLTAYPETASRTDPEPSVDPKSLVGKEVESFDLALSATGSVTAVDVSLVREVTEEQVLAAASPDADMVGGSLAVEIGTPLADGIVVLFPTTGTAEQTARLDPDTIKEEALGKPVDEATEDLSSYGEVTITTWPDWVTSVPNLEGRVEVVITTAPTVTAPGSSPGVTPAGTVTP